jgi:hypothetical protein
MSQPTPNKSSKQQADNIDEVIVDKKPEDTKNAIKDKPSELRLVNNSQGEIIEAPIKKKKSKKERMHELLMEWAETTTV